MFWGEKEVWLEEVRFVKGFEIGEGICKVRKDVLSRESSRYKSRVCEGWKEVWRG